MSYHIPWTISRFCFSWRLTIKTTRNSCLQKSREPEFQIFPSCGISRIGILGSDLLIYCILKTLWSGKKIKEFWYSKFSCLLSAPKQEWNHVVTILDFADWHALIYQSLGTTLFASYLNSLRSIYIMWWHHSLVCLTVYRKLLNLQLSNQSPISIFFLVSHWGRSFSGKWS